MNTKGKWHTSVMPDTGAANRDHDRRYYTRAQVDALLTAKSFIQDADTDTYVRCEQSADEDVVRIGAGGTEYAAISATEIVFNDTGADVDFRVEGFGNANLIRTDAANGRVGIGDTPSVTLDVYNATLPAIKIRDAAVSSGLMAIAAGNIYFSATGGTFNVSCDNAVNISTTDNDADINVSPNGTGELVVNSAAVVDGYDVNQFILMMGL